MKIYKIVCSIGLAILMMPSTQFGVGIQWATKECTEKKQISAFDTLVSASNKFGTRIPFPTKNNRIATIADDDEAKKNRIVWQAENTYPILHAKTQKLITDFLTYKKAYGSPIEKVFYAGISNEKEFITRLLTKRPVMFMTASDQYILRDGTRGFGGFDNIGNKSGTLSLVDYISYDEMAISALLGVSVPTYFVNSGDKNNDGKKGAAGTFESEGIYVGLVGTRFERPELMEWPHIVITEQQNSELNGYGLTKKYEPNNRTYA